MKEQLRRNGGGIAGLNQNFEMLDVAASSQMPTSPATPKSQAKRQRKQCIYWDDFGGKRNTYKRIYTVKLLL
jgi:hypothetical protein